MDHAVAKHFRREREAAIRSFQPVSPRYIEQGIGLERHIQKTMPLFLTLRASDGETLATAMLPPAGNGDTGFRIIIVGKSNSDPFPEHRAAIEALGDHFGLTLDRLRCYPYGR